MDTNYMILKKIGVIEFDGWNTDTAAIRYETFLRDLMTPKGDMITYSSSRTIREKWKTMMMMGFFTRVNQSDVARVDLDYVKQYMGLFEGSQ